MAEEDDTNSNMEQTRPRTVAQQPITPTRTWFGRSRAKPPAQPVASSNNSTIDEKQEPPPTEKWSMGILNDKWTEEVPGTVLLLSSNRNEPLGLRHQPERTSNSSLPDPYAGSRRSSVRPPAAQRKRTPDGQIILDPQPDDSLNDPLNWPALRRDVALLSLGFYCMVGGGMTPILAAGFNDVAKSFNVSYSKVALTTGLYMMGLGVGSVIASPTAIIFGKRPIYLISAIMFILTSVWCALAPNYAQLATARVFQGISVSPVECLPSATIAEIFFLHERAFRIGIYTFLLLGGKNLIPLISAVIIQAKEWRWVFWIVAMVVGFGATLLFLFVPETFWDRTPRPRSRRPTVGHRRISGLSHMLHPRSERTKSSLQVHDDVPEIEKVMTPRQQHLHDLNVHAHFADDDEEKPTQVDGPGDRKPALLRLPPGTVLPPVVTPETESNSLDFHNLNSSHYVNLGRGGDHLDHSPQAPETAPTVPELRMPESAAQKEEEPVSPDIVSPVTSNDLELAPTKSPPSVSYPGTQRTPSALQYTSHLRRSPPKTYLQTLKPWNGRLSRVNWFRAAFRPFILYAYPSVLWSATVYSLSVGWLIVLSESVSKIYRSRDTYNFSALGVGLVYLSPFIGGALGTVVAGKVSDVVVRYLARRNGGVYEPEFRLVMALPILLSTAIGLMGYGWSAQERDRWIVPTIFFGIISFGCSLGSTTSITFCVDSYRQFAGEALVTLNFSKNVLHGLVFSLFFADWLEDDGSKKVFLVIGGIQVALLSTSLPMYIYGKRARMWTVRKRFMENF